MAEPEGKPDFSRLRDALSRLETWPTRYAFKFIVRRAELPHLLALLDGFEIATRDSSRGTYTAVTALARMRSASEVIAVYERVSVIDGVRSL